MTTGRLVLIRRKNNDARKNRIKKLDSESFFQILAGNTQLKSVNYSIPNNWQICTYKSKTTNFIDTVFGVM